MSIYDYQCPSCEHIFESIHGMREKPVITCMRCGTAGCNKLISCGNTSQDKLWEFVDYSTTGKPIEIRSKSQWQKHLKKLGMHDDLKQSRRDSKDFFDSDKHYRSNRDNRRREIKNILSDVLYKK